MIVTCIAGENALQMKLTQDDYMIQAFSSDRANHSLSIRILPRRLCCSFDIFDVKGGDLTAKLGSIDGIAIAKEVSRGLTQSAGLQQLPCGPHGCRVVCEVEMQNLSPVVPQDDQHKENPEGRRRDSEEIVR